jgi:hypothetical protein
MNPTRDRASLLDRLVAVSDGDEGLRALFAESSIQQIEKAIAAYESAKAAIARYGRLGAEWRDSAGVIVGHEDDPPVT